MELPATYKIETERLLIRCYEPPDAYKLRDSITESLHHLRPWLPWATDKAGDLDWSLRFVRQFRGQFDLGQDAVFGIFDKKESRQLGGTGLHNRIGKDAREIGYWIHAGFINQGYATEAVSALIKVGFEIEGLSRIEIHCAPENLPSRNIPEKLGFTHTSTLKNQITDANGKTWDRMVWSLSLSVYENSPLQNTSLKAYDILGREIMLPPSAPTP